MAPSAGFPLGKWVLSTPLALSPHPPPKAQHQGGAVTGQMRCLGVDCGRLLCFPKPLPSPTWRGGWRRRITTSHRPLEIYVSPGERRAAGRRGEGGVKLLHFLITSK